MRQYSAVAMKTRPRTVVQLQLVVPRFWDLLSVHLRAISGLEVYDEGPEAEI